MCKSEDSSIEEISLYSLTQQFASSTSSKMVTKPFELSGDSSLYVTLSKVSVLLKINGIEHTFPTTKPLKAIAQPWYEMATKDHKLPHEHASLLNMAITNLSQDFENGMDKSYNMVTDPVTSEELYKMVQQKKEIQGKLNKISELEEGITASLRKKNSKFFKFMTALCFTQLTVGYYCIFEVEWLGWDLVEPLTYTFGQGSFILGMFYMLRHKKMQGYGYSDLKENFISNKIQKQMVREGDFSLIEQEHKLILEGQLSMIEATI